MFSNDKENKRESISDIGEKMTEYSDKISSKHNVRELGINSVTSFVGIQYSVDTLNELLKTNIPEKSEDIEGEISTIVAILGNIINKCNDYLVSHEPPSRWKSKNARKNLIEELLSQAKEDFSKISDTKIDSIKVKDKETTWNEVISDLRTEEIDVTGRENLTRSTVVGTSDLFTIGEGEKMRFFKDEKAYPRAFRIFASNFAKIPLGSIISNRNVATSRLACLLGVENIITKSNSARITENGSVIKQGNIMDKAKGKTMQDIMSRDPQKVVSGEAQRQLICLQMLDALAGQVDRNLSNYFMQIDENADKTTINGIQGIDNDISFGNLTNKDSKRKNLTWLPLFTNQDTGAAVLECVDSAVASRILAITPELLDFVFFDILSKPERDALKERLEEMQHAINLSKDKEGFMLEPDKWGEDTYKTLSSSKSPNYLKFLTEYLEIK